MTAFEKATKKCVEGLVNGFAETMDWMLDGGKIIYFPKFVSKIYVWGQYYYYDNHRGKAGELCRYSETGEDEILYGVCDVGLKAKRLPEPVIITEQLYGERIWVKGKKVVKITS